MAKKKSTNGKRVARAAVKEIKKGNKAVIALVAFLLVAAIAVGAYWYFCVYRKRDLTDTPDGGLIETGELSIHFMELGNKYAGDSTLIKIGDTEILVDAGSRKSSA
ncbi:MAG: hypothetical protein ACI4NG_06065, partial [Candidatus Gallimonas sp.]